VSAGPADDAGRRRWFHRDAARFWVALLVTTPVGVALVLGWAALQDRAMSLVTAYVLGWVVFSVLYVGLTVRAFGPARGEQLPALLAHRPPSVWRAMIGDQDGPGYGAQFAVLALLGAVLLPRVDAVVVGRAEQALLTGLTIATVATAWVVVVASYTVFYARRDAVTRALRFPGEEVPRFADYAYFALSVATTFGTTDVEVTTSAMRRSVAGHAVLSFVFNTVVLGLVVSALTT